MKVKLIAHTQIELDAVDSWNPDPPDREDGSHIYDNGWKMGDYNSHPNLTVMTPIVGDPDGCFEMTSGGERVVDADELAEVAGRLCYKSWKRPNPATATNQGYIKNIISQQHFSVLEHASATFWISGVSRSLTHELVRHRHLSFSQVSQRYVDESDGSFITHPAMSSDYLYNTTDGPGGATVYQTLLKHNAASRKLYEEIVKDLVDSGVDRKTARGAARGVLPNATATEIIVTGNHRSWREVLSKRLSPGADAEIRQLAVLLLAELKGIAPNTYQDFE